MIEPRQVLVLEKHLIKFYDETDYSFGSSDNIKYYKKVFISGDGKTLSSQIGIELFEDEKRVA